MTHVWAKSAFFLPWIIFIESILLFSLYTYIFSKLLGFFLWRGLGNFHLHRFATVCRNFSRSMIFAAFRILLRKIMISYIIVYTLTRIITSQRRYYHKIILYNMIFQAEYILIFQACYFLSRLIFHILKVLRFKMLAVIAKKDMLTVRY